MLNLKTTILLIVFFFCQSQYLFQQPSSASKGCLNSIEYKGTDTIFTGLNHLDTALYYVGVSDNGNNSGPEVKRFLKSVGLSVGNPWCAAFVSYCLTQGNAETPVTRSGLARKFKTKYGIKAINVFKGIVNVPQGYIVLWEKGKTLFGHIGFNVYEWQGIKGIVVSGNTSKKDGSNGEYVEKKIIEIEPYNYFRITKYERVA